MDEALKEAGGALGRGEVPVGCVYVRDGAVIARGSNRTNEEMNATRHAELVAADSILASDNPNVFDDCELYVTCEPCIMCAAALSRLGVPRVYFGCANDRFGGCGSILSLHLGEATANSGAAFECVSGLRKDEAIELFRHFYARGNEKCPVNKRRRKDGDQSASSDN